MRRWIGMPFRFICAIVWTSFAVPALGVLWLMFNDYESPDILGVWRDWVWRFDEHHRF